MLGAVYTAQHWHPQHIHQASGEVSRDHGLAMDGQSCLLDRGKDRGQLRTLGGI